MNKRERARKLISILGLGGFFLLISFSCSNRKNTAFSRFYHSVNTRYNVHFNANQAYKESLAAKEKSETENDNLAKMLYIYPEILDSTELKYKGSFTKTIDKTTKAIKQHSITTRPRRDPNRKVDKEYREWLNQKEFNSFLINSWMLLGKAEFQEGNYLRAITTFMHISKIYSTRKDIVCESTLWIARSYSEMGWFYEAERILRRMEQADEVLPEYSGMYANIKANLLIRTKEYAAAIPFLEEAISKEKSRAEKRRKQYLLGQLYRQMGEKRKAHDAFAQIKGMSTPYNYKINAKLRQLELSEMSDNERIKALLKFTKGAKNEDYKDVVYTSIGDVYLRSMDTLNAIKNYQEAVENSKKDGYDKALALIKLGGLFFAEKEYIQAQPCYSQALPLISKKDEYYPVVSLRSEVLDKLVVHAKVVQEQDSLLMVANMPEYERIAYIEQYIEKLKKEEEEKKKKEQLARLEALNNSSANASWDNLADGKFETASTFAQKLEDAKSQFYFYNEGSVKDGKVAFQKEWGRRSLEDNWRRSNKQTSNPFGDDEDDDDTDDVLLNEDGTPKNPDEQAAATGSAGEANKATASDIYSVDYYLQQLPLTEEAKEAANKLVEAALFNMGLIYKDLLEDNQLAISTFEEALIRNPETPNKEEIYYNLFLIYLRMGNEPLMAQYRDLIINEFPKSKYAVPLSDPSYAWNFTYMSKMQEQMYQAAYDAYLAGDVNTVRNIYKEIQTKFPFVDMMPKFAFLNSLSYAQTKDAPNMSKYLSQLIKEYPDADVTPLATNILKNIKDGKIILSDGLIVSNIDWKMVYANDSIFEGETAKQIAYQKDMDKPYSLLLMFKLEDIDRNELLYEVADYNFSNYVIQTFDLNFQEDQPLSILEIKGFKDFGAIRSYLNKGMDTDGLLTKIDRSILPIPISASNYADMYPRLGLESYMAFYSDSLAVETPKLLAYWGKGGDILLAEKEAEVQTPEEEKEEKVVTPMPKKEKVEEEEKTIPTDTGEKEEEPKGNEATLEDVLSKDQVQFIGAIDKKTDDIVEGINQLGSNPIEGLKTIFGKKDKFEENLTKEEKEELKLQEKIEKERLKELAKIEKMKADSIAQVEKLRLDSINNVLKLREDSISHAIQAEKDRVKAEQRQREQEIKDKERERVRQLKEKEDERKAKLKERDDRRKAQEEERKERLKQKERERQETLKLREAERKQKEKEAEERRKQQERDRKERERKGR